MGIGTGGKDYLNCVAPIALQAVVQYSRRAKGKT